MRRGDVACAIATAQRLRRASGAGKDVCKTSGLSFAWDFGAMPCGTGGEGL